MVLSGDYVLERVQKVQFFMRITFLIMNKKVYNFTTEELRTILVYQWKARKPKAMVKSWLEKKNIRIKQIYSDGDF